MCPVASTKEQLLLFFMRVTLRSRPTNEPAISYHRNFQPEGYGFCLIPYNIASGDKAKDKPTVSPGSVQGKEEDIYLASLENLYVHRSSGLLCEDRITHDLNPAQSGRVQPTPRCCKIHLFPNSWQHRDVSLR